MIQILFTLIFTEMALILTFLFKTPLRKVFIMGLDRVKRGQAPLVVRAVGSTIFVVMLSTLYSAVKIRNSGREEGEVSPTDQILAATHLLEASLMGFSLFLALMIDRLHHYIRELRIRRKNMEAIKKQNRIIETGQNGSQNEVKALEGEVTTLKEKITHLKSELDEKTKEASNAEADTIALKKQSEGFLLEYKALEGEVATLKEQITNLKSELDEKTKEASNHTIALKKQSERFLLEYDRLLKDNQKLRAQLQSDRRFSNSGSKKAT